MDCHCHCCLDHVFDYIVVNSLIHFAASLFQYPLDMLQVENGVMVLIQRECVLKADFYVSYLLMFFINWNLMISLFVLLFVLSIGIDDFLICSFCCTCIFLNELLHSISSNKLVMVCIGGQISVVQALLEELPGQFLTYMRGRDIKPCPLHVAPTSA